MSTFALSGCRVLYTRAAAYFPAFAEKIQTLGGTALHLPLIDTRALPLNTAALNFCQTADYVIFTSAAAVRHFPITAAPQAAAIAIGPATAAALAEKNTAVFLTAPAPFNSESLLQIFAPTAKNIAIIAAEGGRQVLIEQLQTHNHCQFIFAYERYNPSTTWQCQPLPHAILLSSQTALKNLIEITAQTTLNLLQSQIAVIALSPRIGQAAQSAGFQHVFSAAQADENAQIQQLCQWWHIFKEH